MFLLSSFLKLALHFTQFFPFYFKISTSNNFPSVTFIYSPNFSPSSSIRLIRNLLKGKNKLKKKKTTLLTRISRAWTDVSARITAWNDRVTSVTNPDSGWFSENRKPARPLQARTCTRLSRLAIVSVSIRSTKRREGRSRKQLERRWRLHETAEALEEIPSLAGSNRSVKKSRQTTADPHPLFTPKLKFDFRRKSSGLPCPSPSGSKLYDGCAERRSKEKI